MGILYIFSSEKMCFSECLIPQIIVEIYIYMYFLYISVQF